MPHFSTKRFVSVTPEQAFAIASDVGSYKEFLPLVERSTVRGQRSKNGHVESFDADLAVGYIKLGVRESFKSHVVCDAEKGLVTATSNDGPMKTLTAVWKIAQQIDGKTEVSITIDYTLKSMMLQVMARGLMDFAAQKIMQAFEERGRQLYGTALI